MNTITATAGLAGARRPAAIKSTRTMTMIALLAAISFALSFLEFPVPLSPSFARMDFSDLPAMLGALSLGPWAGLAVEIIKNLLGLFTTATGGVGELANLIMGGTMAVVTGLVYYRLHAKAVTACLLGSLAMAAMAAAANYFILLPLFENFMPVDQLIASFGEFIPFIHTKLDVVLLNAFPFNLLKGLVITAITLPLFKKLTPAMRGKKADGGAK